MSALPVTAPSPSDVTGSAQALAAAVQGVKDPAATTDTPKEELQSPKFAALARREKVLREKQREMEERERALKSREDSLAPPKQAETFDWKKALATDPQKVFAEAGLSGDQMTQALLRDQAAPERREIMQLQTQIEELRGQLGKNSETAETHQQQLLEAARRQMKHDIGGYVDQGDMYEAIQKFGDEAKDEIVSRIEEEYKKNGIILPIDKVAGELEEELREAILELSQTAFVKSKFSAPQETKEADQQTPVTPPQQTQSGTLSNRMAQQTAIPASAKERDRLRRERAILAMQGQLK